MQLTESNFIIYSAHSYTNTNCTDTEEFLEDLKRIRYVKKLFRQHKERGFSEHRIRLIINHLIVLYNVFEPRACTNMLFFKLNEHWDCLCPMLLYLGYLPEYLVLGEYNTIIYPESVIIDLKIHEYLSKEIKGK